MSPQDREALVRALEALEDAAPEALADAARAVLVAQVQTGLAWDSLIAASGWEGTADDGGGMGEGAALDPDTPVERLIDHLLARPGLSDETRGELATYRTAALAGTLDPDDAAYVRALYGRLTG